MGNCLKTQLKEVVNNDKLPVFNKIKIFLADADSYPTSVSVIRLENSEPTAKMKIVNGYFCTGSGVSQGDEIPQRENNIILTAPNAYIIADSPYTLLNVKLYGRKIYDISEVSFCRTIEIFYLNSGENISDKVLRMLSYSIENLNTLVIAQDSNFQSDLKQYNIFTNLTRLSIPRCGIEGNVRDIAACNKLTTLNVHDNFIHGSLEHLCNNMNRNDGATMTVTAHGQAVTIHNTAFPDTGVKVIFTSPSNIVINDSNDNLMVSYDGTNWKDSNNNPYTPA